MAVRGQGRAPGVRGDRDRGTDRSDIDRRLRRRARALDRAQARLVLRARVPQGRDRRDRFGRSDRPDLPRVPVGDGLSRYGCSSERAGRRLAVPARRSVLACSPARWSDPCTRSRSPSSPRSCGCGCTPAASSLPRPWGSTASSGRRSPCPRSSGSVPGERREPWRPGRGTRGDMRGSWADGGRCSARSGSRPSACWCWRPRDRRERPTTRGSCRRTGRVSPRSCSGTMPCCCRTSRSSSWRRRWEGARSSRDRRRRSRCCVPAGCRTLGSPDILDDIARVDGAARSTGGTTADRPMPAGYWAFVLVPAVATLRGGRSAGGPVGSRPDARVARARRGRRCDVRRPRGRRDLVGERRAGRARG